MNWLVRCPKVTTEERQDVLRYLRQGIMDLWTEEECEKLLRCREITVRYEGPSTSAETHKSWVVPVWQFFDETWSLALERHSQLVFPKEAATLRNRWHEFLQARHKNIRAWLTLMQACSSRVPPADIRDHLRRISVLKATERKAEKRVNREAQKLAKRFSIRAEELIEPFASRHAAPKPRDLHI